MATLVCIGLVSRAIRRLVLAEAITYVCLHQQSHCTHLPPVDNPVGEGGVQAFLEAVRLQEKYSRLGPGLLRVALQVGPSTSVHPSLSFFATSLQNLTAPPTSPALQSLTQLLAAKAPSPQTPAD